ncbi:hypothetical protein [Oceanomicrobium pacificus]|uniref:Uncharacterized protein n=1 Tax=Oceanomicrobium pacificus TaxID=2692916 RepID=A0A6B0TY72_9RHOB|nr:hypothetical protein [Oceanomicrobium pacificus]MXU66004.1 hypothetical protein [Oceanomicrobium pacificus]
MWERLENARYRNTRQVALFDLMLGQIADFMFGTGQPQMRPVPVRRDMSMPPRRR